MITYRLRDDLSFCVIDGHPIFLDTRNDRYFRLSGRLERLFLDHAGNAVHSTEELVPLVERDILTATPLNLNMPCEVIPIASRSALESAPVPTECQAMDIAEVFTTVCWTQIQLKTRKLKTILDHLIDGRRPTPTRTQEESKPYLLNETATFLKARKLVPIETCCLLDSLSIVRFLAKKHLHANIVFGVTSDPFSAHCWAQSEDVVLSDTIGHIRAYTVIRVV